MTTAQAKPQLQPTSMIPVFHETSFGMLDAAKEQLASLKKAEGRAHVLNDEIIERVLKTFTEQTDYIPTFLEQCQQWRKEALNERQLQWVSDIEHNVKMLAKINPDILALAKSYEDKTINSILGMDEDELIKNILTGKVDMPL